MRLAAVILLLLTCSAPAQAQQISALDSVGAASVTDNIYNRRLFSDSLATSFCILIKKEVKAHKHLYHSEHVFVLEGEGRMRLGDSTFTIKKGDLVFIPKTRVHAVVRTGKIPLKVLSVQAPYFDGKDRVMVE